ncbi:hypothetical protein C0991_011056 [Blastosporella zonata]|nr:hypothetical protein C0991_011056 [Blastosporella zonata]
MMANIQRESPARKVHPLFDSKEATVALYSAEGTLYRIPSFVLRNTTGYFLAILRMPLPLGQQADSQAKSIYTIVVDETDVVLERILRLISGLEAPMWGSLDEMESVMSLAEKWDAQGPISLIRSAVTAPKFLADPLRLYGIATRFGWEEEAKLASTYTLRLSLFDEEYADKLERLPTKGLLDLLSLHRRRRDLFKTFLDSEEIFTAGNNLKGYCSGCGEQVDNHSWRELKARIFFEIDQCPMGDTLMGLDMEEWREAIACWSAKCPIEDCGRLNYNKVATMRDIQSCLDKLPFTI